MTKINSDNKFKFRERLDKGVNFLLAISIFIAFATLLALIFDILNDGWKWFDWQFINSYPSRKPEIAGIKAAFFGTEAKPQTFDTTIIKTKNSFCV